VLVGCFDYGDKKLIFAVQDKTATKEKKENLEKHLATVQALLENRAEKVTDVQTKLVSAKVQSSESMRDQGPSREVTRKIRRDSLWNARDIVDYLSGLTDVRHVLDLNLYLGLLNEGNDAIRKKEMPIQTQSGKTKDVRKKSRRFDRDFYRTCVGEGLRAICYKFLLPPNRVGIKMEDMSASHNFDFNKAMPGEQHPSPQNWVAPMLESQTPDEFANEVIGSGELVLLSSTGGMDPDDQETNDPLRGCRYVAAMELAHEPRVRRHLRNIYRRHAVLTTRPTKKGTEMIDAFNDYYGLHLIKNKGIKEHFPMDEKESAEKRAMLGPDECRELDREMKKREHDSCLQYLRILKAEHTGHISAHVHLPLLEVLDDWYSQDEQYRNREKQDLSALMQELERVYFPLDGDTEEWNSERKKVLTQSLLQFLLPKFEAEIRRELKEAAVKVCVEAAGENLYNMAMEGPYRPQALMHTENRFLYPTGDLPMVGLCCSSDPKEATYLACVTERGALKDHLAIPGGTHIDSGKYREKVISFLLQSRPAAVLVGTSGGFGSRILHRKMNDLITEAVQRWKDKDIQGHDEDDEDFETRRVSFDKIIPARYDEDEDEEWKCSADLIDDNVAQLFGRSVRGKKEFPDHRTNLKIAISIARYAKDPLGELTYAWSVASDVGNFGSELLYINIHPMQQQLPRTLLLRQYERALCEVVAAVGVDVNAACSLDHLQGLLSFAPGLGPRKAASLKQSVQQLGEVIGSRRFLLEKRLIGPVVYNNAVAFLRIRNVDVDDGQIMNPLDDTRLHPDVYNRNNWAVKIATDALERAEDETRNKERAGIKALRDVMDNSAQEVERLFLATKEEWESLYGPTFKVFEWNPRVSVPANKWRDKVEELDLDAFADMIEQSGQGKWNSHLQMIKWEFRLPYADPRTPMEPLTGDKLFKLITGESDQSLRPGKEVTGKVVRNGDFGSRVKLEGEIPAFIPLRNLADEHVEAAEDVVTIGMVVTAVITEVKKDHMCVDMSLKMEDFKKQPSSWDRPASLPALDDHFDWRASQTIDEKKSKEREARLEAQHLSLGHTTLGDDGAPKKRMGRIARRACAHPAFRNARHEAVDKELRGGGLALVGEALVRPSSKSSESLAVHWVIQEGVIKVVEVIEEDKDTDASIGNILKIKVRIYDYSG
jgi:transcription elongation factor SPT6